MPDGVRIREARPDDAAAIADVHAAAIRDRGSDAYDNRQLEAWLANVHPERYPIGESDAGLHVIVAERDAATEGGRIVGFGWLDCASSGRGDGTGEVVAVYVRPDHAREGIGRTLLAELEAIACEAELAELVLVASKNAIEFYRERGYEAEVSVELEMQAGVELEGLRMRKRLR